MLFILCHRCVYQHNVTSAEPLWPLFVDTCQELINSSLTNTMIRTKLIKIVSEGTCSSSSPNVYIFNGDIIFTNYTQTTKSPKDVDGVIVFGVRQVPGLSCHT